MNRKRANYQLWIKQWLIDWLTKETHWRWMSWKGKVWLIQWEKWMNEYHWLIWFYLFVRLNWLRWMRKLWMLCDCPLASLIWFLFCWLIDSFHLSLIDWFVCSWEWIELIDWEKKRKLTNGNWNKQANDNEKDCWLICLLSQSIEIHHHHHQTWLIDWMNEWKIELISTSKTNQASIQVADYWNNKQTNKQLTLSGWLIDWLEIGKRSDIKMRLISFHFLLAFFDLVGWLICELIEFGIDWFGDDFQISLFLSFSHSLTWLTDT